LKVGVVLSMSENSLEIKVRDQGTGVKGEVHAPDIDKKMHGEESPRGLGMFLIQSLVDEAEWVSSAEDGGCTRLVIYLREPRKK
jgi:serine/threonine-protein kinase RsbW